MDLPKRKYLTRQITSRTSTDHLPAVKVEESSKQMQPIARGALHKLRWSEKLANMASAYAVFEHITGRIYIQKDDIEIRLETTTFWLHRDHWISVQRKRVRQFKAIAFNLDVTPMALLLLLLLLYQVGGTRRMTPRHVMSRTY